MADDISRNTFDPAKHHQGVRLQQGRVWVEADFNEQVDIVNHRLEQTPAVFLWRSWRSRFDPEPVGHFGKDAREVGRATAKLAL